MHRSIIGGVIGLLFGVLFTLALSAFVKLGYPIPIYPWQPFDWAMWFFAMLGCAWTGAWWPYLMRRP